MQVHDGEGSAPRPELTVQPLRPNAAKSVALRQEVEQARIWREDSIAVKTPAVGYGYPLALRGRGAGDNRRHEDLPPYRPDYGVKDNPPAVGREPRAGQVPFRMLQEA